MVLFFGRCFSWWPKGRIGWHLGGSILILLSFSFVFGPVYGAENADPWAKVVYYAPFVVLFQVGWASVQISHLALLNDLTYDPGERVLLASLRYFFNVLSSLAVYLIAFLLLRHSATADSQSGFSISSDLSRHVLFNPLELKVLATAAGNASADSLNIDFGPADVNIFRNLALILLAIGSFFTVFFYLGTPNPHFTEAEPISTTAGSSLSANENTVACPTEYAETQPILTLPPEILIQRPLDWFKVPEFLLLCPIYMLVRLIINISQVYITLYLLASLGLPKPSIALIPLTIYLTSAFTSLVQKPFHDRLSRELASFIGIAFIITFCLLTLFPGSPVHLWRVYFAAGILGVGCTILLVTSLAMVGDLIHKNQSTGAFVYGVMSFADKMANGIVVQVIQILKPCTNCRAGSNSYYMFVESYGVLSFVVLVALLILVRLATKGFPRLLLRRRYHFSETRRPPNYSTVAT
uniref:Major facilitator superfamily domain-containing protein 12 n=1 Tax=Schistocephalus solidus TaxID=70667 RepID=A0A0X3P4W1_SCHSO